MLIAFQAKRAWHGSMVNGYIVIDTPFLKRLDFILYDNQ